MCVCVCCALNDYRWGRARPPFPLHYIAPSTAVEHTLSLIYSLCLALKILCSKWLRERERARATAISWWISRVLRRNDNFDVWPNRTECITLDKPDHTGSLPLPFSCHSIEHTPSVCVYADIFLCVSAICECAKSHSSINFGHFLFSLLL